MVGDDEWQDLLDKIAEQEAKLNRVREWTEPTQVRHDRVPYSKAWNDAMDVIRAALDD